MASTTANPATPDEDGMTMEPMPQTKHAKPKDHLWVLAVIAAACLIKVWPSWVGIGAEARFPEIVKMPTDWTLAVVVEAYWAYAVFAWLAASAGRRSRKFAMWSAGGVFLLSLTAQSSASLMSARAAGAFANAMPVTILALIAVLVHLRHLDRAESAQTEEAARKTEQRAAAEAAAADERTALRAELEAARTAVEPLRADLETARNELARVTAKAEAAEALAQKLKAATARKRGAATGRKRVPATARKSEPVTGSAAAPEDGTDETANVDKEALVLRYLAEGYSASKAGIKAGLSDSRGRQIARDLAKAAPQGVDERADD